MNSADLQSRPERAGDGALDFRKEIAFRNINFTYRNAAGPALTDISFSIARGESVGLVGTSGAGKSTLVDILMGLLEPGTGNVTVDGVDIGSEMRKWRRLVGYVPQSISLIDDTMRNNIAFGIPAAEIDDARVWQVLQMARLEALVRAMPEGLDTMLGERGARLSGGERQRVGIARALYHDPQMLVFDEATSALDNESEYEITRATEALRGQKTMLVIAHRLSTVKSCDRLMLMRGGRIAESGDFAGLMARSPDFRRMVQLTELTGADSAPELH
jgi:ATP-binding cassette subfamily C protein